MTPQSELMRNPVGARPGSLTAVPDSATDIELISFNSQKMIRESVGDPSEVEHLIRDGWVTWVNVIGVDDGQVLAKLSDAINLHRLALEDVQNLRHRPKMEEYDEHLFVILRQVSIHEALDVEQVSLFLGKNYVVTFQERIGDPFEPVRKRLEDARGRIRSMGADYLGYALMDAIVDSYFPVLESYADRLEAVEDRIGNKPDEAAIEELQTIRSELRRLKRLVWPMREFLAVMVREDYDLIGDEVHVFLRDCDDHAQRIMDLVESYREWSSDLIDYFNSLMSNRMNEVMRTLTVIATIFIPLTFLAGIYGMNFDPEVSPWNMPELGWRYGYPVLMGIMLTAGLLLVVFFVRKGWIGGGGRRPRMDNE